MAIKLKLPQIYAILSMVLPLLGVSGLSMVVSPSPTVKVLSGQTLSITCQWSADYTGQNAAVNYKLNDGEGRIGEVLINFGTGCPSISPYTLTCNRDTRTLGIQIPVNSYSHGDRWTCEGRKDNFDNTTPQTDTTTVDVIVPVTTVIITPSTTVTVDVGTSTTLTCTTQPHSRPTANVTWYRVVSGQPQQITANISVSYDTQNSAKTTTSVLSYVPTKEDNGRTVYCTSDGGWKGSTGTTLESARVSLNVRYAPIITLSACPETVNETDNYRCTCTAVGNPNPTVTWYPRDSSTNNILDLPYINRNKAGRYTCNATSSSQKFGTLYTQSDLNLVVRYAPDVELLVQNTTEYDTHLVMTCNASGVPNVYIYGVWAHMYGTTLVRNLTGDVTTQGRTLTLASVSYQDTGNYTCQVQNSIRGRDGQLIQTGTAVFDVRGSPRLLESKSIYVTEKKNHLNITMTFISHPSPTDTFISKTARLSSTTDLNITFKKRTVKDNIYGKVISREGCRVHLDFPSFQINQEGDYSLTVTNNISPNLIHSFEIGIVDVPDSPTNISADMITTESAFISWTPGLNRGRDNQSFHLWMKESTADAWTKYNTSQDVSKIVISDLRSASTFMVVLFAANEKGSSNHMKLQFTTLSAVEDPFVAPLIGGISGGIIGLLLITIGIVLYRRMSDGTNNHSGNRSDAPPFNNDRDDDDGMKMNILYESAGPYQPEDLIENGQPENAYAVVNKKIPAEVKKKTPAGAVYAEVVPKKDRKTAKGKPEGKPEGSGDLYAEVQKAEKKKKKQKKPSKDNQGGTVYENAGAVGGKPKEVYANTDDTASKLEPVAKNGSKDSRRKNKDGLVYLDLKFQQQPDGTRQAVIRGIENRNDYSEVDFAKRADPMSAEDDDVNEDEKKN